MWYAKNRSYGPQIILDEESGTVGDEAPAPPERHNLSYRINRLFETLHPRERGEHTLQEVIDGIRAQGGPTLSLGYLWQLRHGVKDNPTKQHLEALARFFGVSPAYFFDGEAFDEIDAQLELYAAMRDHQVRELALRAADLSPRTLRAMAQMIQRARELEGLDADEGQADSGRPGR